MHNSKIPDFESPQLPDFLLKDANDKDKYLIEQANKIDKINRTVDWLAQSILNQNEVLEIITQQVQKTNGRVTKSESDIKEIKEKDIPVIKNELGSWIFVKNLSKKKWVWAISGFAMCFVLFGIVPFVNENGGIVSFLGATVRYFLG